MIDGHLQNGTNDVTVLPGGTVALQAMDTSQQMRHYLEGNLVRRMSAVNTDLLYPVGSFNSGTSVHNYTPVTIRPSTLYDTIQDIRVRSVGGAPTACSSVTLPGTLSWMPRSYVISKKNVADSNSWGAGTMTLGLSPTEMASLDLNSIRVWKNQFGSCEERTVTARVAVAGTTPGSVTINLPNSNDLEGTYVIAASPVGADHRSVDGEQHRGDLHDRVGHDDHDDDVQYRHEHREWCGLDRRTALELRLDDLDLRGVGYR